MFHKVQIIQAYVKVLLTPAFSFIITHTIVQFELIVYNLKEKLSTLPEGPGSPVQDFF